VISSKPDRQAGEPGTALPYVPAERLYPCTNCGMAPMPSRVAYAKLAALAAGAEFARTSI
jgi:5-methyltetrahydropteroyltriglutamate--homocysteine methyltransferase